MCWAVGSRRLRASIIEDIYHGEPEASFFCRDRAVRHNLSDVRDASCRDLTTFARQRTTQMALAGPTTAFASARLSSFQNFKSGTEVAQRDFLPVRNGGIFRSFEVEIGTDFTMYFEVVAGGGIEPPTHFNSRNMLFQLKYDSYNTLARGNVSTTLAT